MEALLIAILFINSLFAIGRIAIDIIFEDE